MAYAEKRGNLWRARWNSMDGRLESTSGFTKKRDAEKYGQAQEAKAAEGTYVDPRTQRTTLTEWVNLWYPALDLEPTTMANYRYLIEAHILPAFGDRELASLTAEQVAVWERKTVTAGYSRRTAGDARSTLTTILADAMPRYIQTNPAARRRGKGRKGRRRIEAAERAEKVWASPLQALLMAERCAALSGSDTDFALVITLAYTGMRWGEALALQPKEVHRKAIDVHWKVYELGGYFYRGRPKDGSMRTADLPPFLHSLLGVLPARACTCQPNKHRPPSVNALDVEWCPGGEYVFLGRRGGHFRRSNYGERYFRPAADGQHPERKGSHPRPAIPVLVDASGLMPGKPLPAWLVGTEGTFMPPPGRGRPRPAPTAAPASWLPIASGLTPHGLRHGHQTWMDGAGVPYVLQAERMGHEVPGMRGTYAHVSPAMRADLTTALQALWETSLRQRAALSPRSSVDLLDSLLAAVEAE